LKMSEQRVPFEVREEARDGLADWWADKIDTGFFNQIAGNTTVSDIRLTGMQAAVAPDTTGDSQIVVGPNSTTSSATVNFELSAIDVAVELAQTRELPIRPLMIGGDAYYVLFVHPFQGTNIRRNTNTAEWADFQKAALQGGRMAPEDNPIFAGAEGMYNGTIIHRSTRVPAGANNSAGGSTRRAIFAGAQAAAVAFGYENGPNQFSWVEELFDYENQLGVAAGAIWGLKKLVFNSKDFATITITSAAASNQA
jgi:N4-gp56 family major capsid protein